ncbi:uncharacterized protein LOC114728067 [Neltuma alba]|nr:uncharacterized protein LOC114728067 [Prosopis alba]
MTWDEAILSAEGFGFDCSSNDFKIVSLLYRRTDPFRFIIEVDSAWIFSYVSWSWKRLTIPSSWFAYRAEPPVFFNGVLYWRAYHEEEGSDDYDFILTFNLTHEVFGRILFPSDARLMGKISVVTTGDSLLLIQETYEWHFDESDEETDEDEQVSNQFTIWITKGIDNHESWMNIFSITSEMDPDHILGARKNGDLILYMDGGQILRFNPTTPTNLLVGAIEKSVSFRYHNESLYLLEKGEGVHSY